MLVKGCKYVGWLEVNVLSVFVLYFNFNFKKYVLFCSSYNVDVFV